MNNTDLIEKMVNRFLMWKLPEDFSPDCGISFKREEEYAHPQYGRHRYVPIGTNLLSADQARQMIEHMLGDAPEAAQPAGEPVAQLNPGNFRQEPDGKEWCRQVLLYSPNSEADKFRGVNTRVKLYTHPAPQVPMTDKEIVGAWIQIADPIALGGALPRENAVREFVRAIEAFHKIGVKP